MPEIFYFEITIGQFALRRFFFCCGCLVSLSKLPLGLLAIFPIEYVLNRFVFLLLKFSQWFRK